MWIFCGGMQRSASTLQYQIASEIVERYCIGERITWVDAKEHKKFFKNNHAHRKKFLVFKSHALTLAMRNQIDKKNATCIYIYRDLRDVISSLKEKNQCSYTNTEIENLTNNLIESHKRWTSLPNIHISKYEECIADISKEVSLIGKFIGILLGPKEIKEISAKFSLKEQVRTINKIKTPMDFGGSNVFDSHSLLHLNHINSAEVGRHKKNLSRNQIAIINKILEDNLFEN